MQPIPYSWTNFGSTRLVSTIEVSIFSNNPLAALA